MKGMIDWSKIFNESPIDWLLEESSPSVRYFTMRDILDKPEDDKEMLAARRAISGSIVVQKILGKQSPDGYWGDPHSLYLPKYKSSYWTVMVLAQLGMDRGNQETRKAFEFLFRYQLEEGGFSTQTSTTASKEYEYQLRKGKKLPSRNEFESSHIHESELSCLTGNMVTALLQAGYLDDARVKKAINWLVKIQNRDGGWLCPYWKAHIRDKHGCFAGTICALGALSELPRNTLTTEIKKTIAGGAEFLLMHRLFRADHHSFKVINHGWLTLSFPWFASYTILRGLDTLTKLGYAGDERMNGAVEMLLQKRSGDGKWILENTPTGRMQANFETKGQPSKWITLIALRVLRRIASNV